jgi:hypothetical protein
MQRRSLPPSAQFLTLVTRWPWNNAACQWELSQRGALFHVAAFLGSRLYACHTPAAAQRWPCSFRRVCAAALLLVLEPSKACSARSEGTSAGHQTCAARRRACAHPANAGNKRFTGDRVAKTQKKTKKIDWTAVTAPPEDAKIRRESAGQRGSSACVCECRGCSH